MQRRVYFAREYNLPRSSIAAHPGFPERIKTLPPAFRARTMAGRKCDSFIKKKQLRIAAGSHHGTAPSLELQEACDPAMADVLTHNFAPVVVQRSAPVAHERPPGRRTENHTKRIDTIL